MNKFEKTWKGKIVEHKGFKDLGNYVIELPEFTDPQILKDALFYGNALADHAEFPPFGCTSMATRNSKGEVVTGRNMDLDISQSPAYVFQSSFGKYKNVCVSYSPNFYKPYSEVQKLDEIDPVFKSMMFLSACDCMNEKGLYMEVNLREKDDKLFCYGLHSSKGEKTRADGTPWSELRACTTGVCQIVTENCATVKEAVEFLNNSYDWYSIAPPVGQNLAVSQNNLCYLIADATGEYGVIEFAQDEINYIPYQFGQANFYLTPKWNAIETCGAGHGRLQMVSKVIRGVETLEEAMDAMKPIMWRNAVLWVGESKRINDGSHLHRYNQVVCMDDTGTPQLDWRGDNMITFPVLDDERMIVTSQFYSDAVNATYDPMIKKFFEDAIATGRLIVDDGSIKFNVCGNELTLTELCAKHDEYGVTKEPEKRAELKPYFKAYNHLIRNSSAAWVYDDDNFEALKAGVYAKLHIRYNAEGKADPNAMSKYEKLCAFYGKGRDKDETPLRDDASIWTTSLNVGTNCAKREIKIRFWENDEVIFHAKF